jgi:hypothetical protein
VDNRKLGQRIGYGAGTRQWTAARMSRALLVLQFSLAGIAWAGHASAASPRPDYDIDDDGLIEIDDVGDLDNIRNHPAGDMLHNSDAGCPTNGCFGFELTTDLDFDTNMNGSVGMGDTAFTDDGSFRGFLPIPEINCVFDGNGHTITNLTNINSSDTLPQGLFGAVSGASVSDLNLVNAHLEGFSSATGVLAGQLNDAQVTNVSVSGGSIYANGTSYVGGLAGTCNFSQVDESRTAIRLRASDWLGGLIGIADDCFISRSFTLGRTTSDRYHNYVGGLVGFMISGSITDSFASGITGEGGFFGGLVGQTDGTPAPTFTNTFVSGAVVGNGVAGGGMVGFGPATFVSSFYATDTTGFSKTKTAGNGAVAVTLADLKCPDTASDPDCLPGLFAGWQNRLNLDGQLAWDFGTNQQVPALRIQGVVYRDSDGDGVLDADDQFPSNWEASRDSDGDGAIDFWREGCDEACRASSVLVLDQFPTNPAAVADLDLDGLPDAWPASCNATCQAASGLTLDTRPGDLDNDGISDAVDQDDDGSGMPDVDLDSDNLIDVDSLYELWLAHNDPTGISLRTTGIPEFGDVENNSGCRPRIVGPVIHTGGIMVTEGGTLARHCAGYELLSDLDFDTNGNNVIDEAEKFWGYGEVTPEPNGWDSIGHLGDDPHAAFQAIFEGNGHVIKNLWIALQGAGEAALFGGIRGADIRNIGLTGALAMVGDLAALNDGQMAGALVAQAQSSIISNSYATIPVNLVGGDHAGGLVGILSSSTVVGSFATGDVATVGGSCAETSCDGTGGLVGSMDYDSTVIASFASGSVSGVGRVGGLVGQVLTGSVVSGSFATAFVEGTANEFGGVGGLIGRSDDDVVASYWATDSSDQTMSDGNAQPATNAQLQCPVSADNTTCLPGVTLFDDWGTYVGEDDVPYWEMGSSTQLPGLCLSGKLYRANTNGDLLPVTPCACAQTAQQLVSNQTFETNTAGWVASFGATIATSTTQKHGGTRSLRISNRNSGTWQGAIYNLLSLAAPGDTLTASLWARVEGDPSEPVYFTQRSVCQGGSPVYTRIAEATATNTAWVQLSGTVIVPSCTLTELSVYAEGPRTTVVLYIDDVSVTHEVVQCTGTSGPLNGSFIVTTDWGTGYCVELRITNPNSTPTTDWSASFNTNGTTIYDAWSVNRTASTGSITMTPSEPWARVIPAGGHSYSLGFCANRPAGSSALPSTPVVTGVF